MSLEMPVDHLNSSNTYRLLVVDDDQIQHTIISKIGKQAGFEVTVASSFEEAAGRLKEHWYHCVTLDLSLGEHSGALLLRNIAESGYCTPVVVISGAIEHVLNSTVSMAQALKLDPLSLSKPLNLAALRAVLIQKRQSAQTLGDLMQMAKSSLPDQIRRAALRAMPEIGRPN